jgi:uracil-DNA glycosylase family 4
MPRPAPRPTLRALERAIPRCRRCPRLVAFLAEARRRHPDYWNRPVPGFGDPRAWLVVVGLAPGMHGANRTGRPFRGDASGDWLYGSLGRAGLWDGRRLRGAYIANAVKCVPPGNRPTADELDACRPWLAEELARLGRARLVLALGRVAQQAVLRAWDVAPLSRFPFAHATLHRVPDRPPLLSSYHPSRQNTNTGTLTPAMWNGIWRRVRRFASEAA